jgi:hypothetical protein
VGTKRSIASASLTGLPQDLDVHADRDAPRVHRHAVAVEDDPLRPGEHYALVIGDLSDVPEAAVASATATWHATLLAPIRVGRGVTWEHFSIA